MSALPHQTAPKYLTSLRRVIALKPEHISAYSLMIEPGTPFYDKYRFDAVKREAGMMTEWLPSEDTEYEICARTKELLEQAGYCHYEISNYAKPGYECRHNIGYWKRSDYLGMGLGAASLFENIRYTNERDLSVYMEKTTHIVPVELEDVGSWEESIATNLHIEADVISRKSPDRGIYVPGTAYDSGNHEGGFSQKFRGRD